jgi:hypothetical protein
MARAPLAALLLAAAAIAGCGASTASEDTSDRFQGQQRLVANTVENLQGAAEDEDQNKICRDLLSAELRQQLSRRGPCPRTVTAALEDTDSNELDTRSVRIDGDRATARVRMDLGNTERFANLSFVRERNGWRIDSFG